MQSIYTALIIASIALLTPACFTTELVDDISTEIRVTELGEPGEAVEIRKRFRFTYDPADAAGLYLVDTDLYVLDPAGQDLSFIHRISIYVEEEDESRTLVATGEGYAPGERTTELKIEFEDDLRRFARDDSRVVFVFVIEPSAWARPLPPGGIVVLALASIEILL
jgi:hypothetical protein